MQATEVFHLNGAGDTINLPILLIPLVLCPTNDLLIPCTLF